jgi:hypothetical protein
MNGTTRFVATAALLSLVLAGGAQAQQAGMTFFITSAGPGKAQIWAVWPARTSFARRWRVPPGQGAAPGVRT